MKVYDVVIYQEDKVKRVTMSTQECLGVSEHVRGLSYDDGLLLFSMTIFVISRNSKCDLGFVTVVVRSSGMPSFSPDLLCMRDGL